MSEQEAAPKAVVTTPGDREIHIERFFEARRERVFAAHVDPSLIPLWWGRRARLSTSVFHDPQDRTGMVESGMESGLQQIYARLDALSAGQAADQEGREAGARRASQVPRPASR